MKRCWPWSHTPRETHRQVIRNEAAAEAMGRMREASRLTLIGLAEAAKPILVISYQCTTCGCIYHETIR